MHKKSDCKFCRKQLWAYLSNETDPAQTALIAQHISHCPSCAEEEKQLRKVFAVLKEDTAIKMPATFAPSLHEKLLVAAAEMEKQQSSKTLFKDFAGRLKSAPSLRILAPALACFVLAIGVFSSGLYREWLHADDTLQAGYTPAPIASEAASDTNTPAAVSSKAPAPLPAPAPDPDPNPDPDPVSQAPTPHAVAPAETEIASPPARETTVPPSTETLQSEQDTSAAYTPIPARLIDPCIEDAPLCLLYAEDPRSFLEAYAAETGFDWESKIQPAESVNLPGTDAQSDLVLKLSSSDFAALASYAETKGLRLESPCEAENQGEILVLLTGNEG